jgi:membrane protein YqaA with SNARE-associated domain
MDTSALVQELGIYIGTFVVCLASGIVPVVNAELYLVGLVILAPASHDTLLLVLMATLGQMTAKVAMYWAARGMLNISLTRYEAAVDKWRVRFQRSGSRLSLFIFVSAFIGLPPFFVTSILAGMLRVSFLFFCLMGFCGRFARFLLFVLFPKAMMEIF